jgi:ribosomal protein S18 acetylase RimI-like enzyme
VSVGASAVRPLGAADRASVDGILRALRATGIFNDDEVETALELIDEWLQDGDASGYLTYVIEDATGVRGYVCFGPTPMTAGTYDLYWIAVDPATQGRGYGRRLLAFAEAEVERRGGRLLLIETSSQVAYGATIRFYERSGYDLAARIANFYRPGDHKLVYAKEFGSPQSD